MRPSVVMYSQLLVFCISLDVSNGFSKRVERYSVKSIRIHYVCDVFSKHTQAILWKLIEFLIDSGSGKKFAPTKYQSLKYSRWYFLLFFSSMDENVNENWNCVTKGVMWMQVLLLLNVRTFIEREKKKAAPNDQRWIWML